MKRTLAILLALMLVGCAALAEAAVQDEGFVFRNGITWGMTPEEVAAAENIEEADAFDYGEKLTFMEFEDVKALANTEGDANFIFLNGALVVCGYEFDEEDIDVQTVLEAVKAEYGEPTDSDPATLNALLGALTGPSELEDGAFFAGWTLPDGTYVGITDSFDDIELAYFDAPAIGAQAE